ncbi:glutamate--tRNA ligase [Heliorestis acidaminivorans]|uniref:Glutamate--tRNA ligase n=1 Tax=Heliorestis acidaminivorans TaxID=553427 RepID=A0A6I0ENU0_9FIRM|nr:glutamate--tRNA ligase [Heliorestis acidaminivorans]KAB2951437.1 glutamate--tRNA ligase [Heliorestis acidaminivorans]
MTDTVRVRFAPSPTGPLHIGGARSALFNFLLAHRYGGKFIVRIEDTDLERSSRESEHNILESLRWLGIQWDEGVDVGGNYGPYRQTERLESYQKGTEKLLAQGDAYRCYCSEEEIEAERQAFLAKGELPRYSGKCRSLTEAQEEQYQQEGRKAVVRFRVPEQGAIVVDDLVRGEISFDCIGIGDFVIVKSDGIPTYNYAVVVDDALMEITHVIRGEEHLSNTPRQLLIYKALQLKEPRFAHVSLILGKDRSKMSKRHGSTSIVNYREQGYLPEALVNFLVLLGWSPEGEEEIFSLEALTELFSLERVAKNPAVFDLDKLNWLNGLYIRQTPIERLVEMAIPHLQEAGYVSKSMGEEEQNKVQLMMQALQEKLAYVGQVKEYGPLFFDEKVTLEDDTAKAHLLAEEVPLLLQAFVSKLDDDRINEPASIKKILKELGKETKLSGKALFMPLRVAISGQQHGPDLPYLIAVLGKEGLLKRLRQTTEQAGLDLSF